MSGTNDDLFDGHYQTEYKGPVGFEKKTHKDHFSGIDRKLKKTEFDSGYIWVQISPGKYSRQKVQDNL